MGDFLCSLCVEPWGNTCGWTVMMSTINNCLFPVAYGFHGYKSYSKAGVLSTCASDRSLKRRTKCRFKPCISQEEAGNWEVTPNCSTLCQGWGLWQECVSAFFTHFNCEYFLICLTYRISFRCN